MLPDSIVTVAEKSHIGVWALVFNQNCLPVRCSVTAWKGDWLGQQVLHGWEGRVGLPLITSAVDYSGMQMALLLSAAIYLIRFLNCVF